MRALICAIRPALAATTAGAAEDIHSANYMLPHCKAFADVGMHPTNITNAVGASYCNGMISMLAYVAPTLGNWPERCRAARRSGRCTVSMLWTKWRAK